MFEVAHFDQATAQPAVVAGRLPAPVASSRLRGWNWLVVERFCAEGLDVVMRPPAVLVTLHFGPRVEFVQTRHHQVDRRRLGQGDATVTTAGEPKGWQARGRTEFAAVWLDPALIDNVAAHSDDIAPEQLELVDNFGTPDAQLERMGLSLLLELEHEQCAAGIVVESLAIELTVHLLRRYSKAASVESPPRCGTCTLPASKLRHVSEYLDNHLRDDLTLAEIAQVVGMSPYHFARRFKQSTGIAPHQYLIARRMARAKALLRETDLPIGEIAHRVGCSNQSHFSTLFHRAEAMTPRMFRHMC